jgi:hypothetical protein
MKRLTTDWARNLKQGTHRLFGFLQVDIAKHSALSGADVLIANTRGKLDQHVRNILNTYRGQELHWAGDGGAFLFLIDDGSEYDEMVTGALQILDALPFFNRISTINTLDVPLRLRISCHVGTAIWDSDLQNVYGRALNYFLKSDRDIGAEGTVAITEEVFDQLRNAQLRVLFTPYKEHEYSMQGKAYSRTIYGCSSLETIIRAGHSPEIVQYPDAQTLAPYLQSANAVDLLLAGGDSFYPRLSDAIRTIAPSRSDSPLKLRVLLRRSSTAGARSAKKYESLAHDYGIRADIRWYDFDFMLRGYCFDRNVGYFSYFLREGGRLTGRLNSMLLLVAGRSTSDDYLLSLFGKTFDAFFNREDAAVSTPKSLPFVTEL